MRRLYCGIVEEYFGLASINPEAGLDPMPCLLAERLLVDWTSGTSVQMEVHSSRQPLSLPWEKGSSLAFTADGVLTLRHEDSCRDAEVKVGGVDVSERLLGLKDLHVVLAMKLFASEKIIIRGRPRRGIRL